MLVYFTLLCNVVGVGVCISECLRVRGWELCTTFQYSVSIQQGVMLLHCRQERTDCTCVGCVFTLYTQQCQFFFFNKGVKTFLV